MQQKLLVTFGLPGVGKTFVARVLEKQFGYYFYEGDTDLTPDMREAIQHQMTFTDTQRQIFFKNLITSVKKISSVEPHLVVAQTFIKEIYRQQFLHAFPQTQFLLIGANEEIRQERLRQRKEMPLASEYAAGMVARFELPQIPHTTIENNTQGEEKLIPQLQALIVRDGN